MLYIRADGNSDIGMGHVMRCLSVAEAVSELGAQDVLFITADGGCRAMIEGRGFGVIALGTDYRDMMGELPMLEKLLCARVQNEISMIKGRDVVLVDSYQAGDAYYRELGKLAAVACFEDIGQAYPVDLLINYNIYAPGLEQGYKMPRDGADGGYPKKVLLGAEYMPLGKAFCEPCDYRVKDKVTSVIITTGGSDPHFAAGAFADSFLNDSFLAAQGIMLHLVSGPFNTFAGELKRRYGACQNVEIHENVRDMRSLLTGGDVVVTAAGSTVYEVSALGVPMVVFYFAENQRRGAEALGAMADIVNAGNFASDSGLTASRVVEATKRCVRDKSYRELLHRQEKGLVDGRGALRIAESLNALEKDW